MALCPLTQGIDYQAGCTAFAGGVKRFAFVEGYNKGTAITIAAGVVTAMTLVATKTFRVYSVKKNNSFWTDNITRSDAGAVSYAPTFSLMIPDLTTQVRQEVQLLAQNSLVGAVMDFNNVWRLAGYYNLLELTTGDVNGGTVVSDSQKQTLTFVGLEMGPMLEINTATATSLGLPLT